MFSIFILIFLLNVYLSWKKRAAKKSQNLKKIRKNLETFHKKQEAEKLLETPEIKNLKTCVDEFQKSKKWINLITVGEIYRTGSYPRYAPNPDMAMKCFSVAAKCPDKNVSGLGQSKFFQCRVDVISSTDINGRQIPVIYGEMICQTAESKIRLTPYHEFERPVSREIQRTPTQVNTPTNNTPTQVNTPIIAYTGGQNVHDHSVGCAIKKNIIKLKESSTTENFIEEVRDNILLQDEIDEDDKTKALMVLDSLNENKHSLYDASEKEVLGLVWKKIQDMKEEKNLKETLVKQLASGVEKGLVVCSTGKITRMMSVFDGIEKTGMEDCKPLWAVKEELATLAAKVRDEHIFDKNGLSEDAMIRDFESRVKKEYITNLKMSEAIIVPLMKTYSEAF